MNLVTGATGIVGSHVVLALLQNNEEVVACRQKNSDITKTEKLFSYYSSNHQQLFKKIKWVEIDLRDIFSLEEALEGITSVYHCAGFVSFNKSDKKNLVEINEKGTRNIVNACLAKNIKALCHVSSIATINNSDYVLPLNERVFWKTSGKESDYALSKYNAEREVWRGIEEGLNAVIVNPGLILSPGFWDQSSSKLFQTCYKGNKFYTNGSSGYVAAIDVAKIMLELVSKKLFGNRYILIENNYTFLEIFNKIQGTFGKPKPSINISRTMLNTVRIFELVISLFLGKQTRLSKDLINAAYNNQVFSNQKIKAVLAFEFKPVSHIIEQICGYYKLEKSKT